MQAIKAVFDGNEIKPTEPIKTKKRTEVLVIFPDEYERKSSEEARRLRILNLSETKKICIFEMLLIFLAFPWSITLK